MSTSAYRLRRFAKGLGTLRRRLFERNDTKHLFSSPENARRLEAAMRRIEEGKGTPTTLAEIRARLGLDQ
jgi:hypothetical protein